MLGKQALKKMRQRRQNYSEVNNGVHNQKIEEKEEQENILWKLLNIKVNSLYLWYLLQYTDNH